MISSLEKYVAVFLTGFLVTFLLTPGVRYWAWRWGVVDHPDGRRLHKKPTPRGGGIAVVAGVHSACLMALAMAWAQYARDLALDWWKSYAAASLIVLILGVIDDVRGLRPWTKLMGQILAASVVYFSGASINHIFGWVLPEYLAYAVTVFWLLAVINAFNLIDGLDGLACGLAITSSLGLSAVLVLQRAPGDSMLLLALVGACLGFLRYNFHPASIFLGDSGSMFLGLTLGAVSLKTFTSSSFLLSMAIPVLVLGVPLFDTLLAVWRRSVRLLPLAASANGTGAGIMRADLEHLHHRLLKMGWNSRRVASVLWLTNGVLVTLGILIIGFRSYALGIFMVAMVAGSYVLLRHVVAIELMDTGKAVLFGFRRPSRKAVKALMYPLWDVMCLAGALALAVRWTAGADARVWEIWLLSLPVWVTPTFALLVVFSDYQVVWTRAQAMDLLKLEFGLWIGLGLSVTMALLFDPERSVRTWWWALTIGGLSHPAIIASRLFYRCAEEVVAWSNRVDEKRHTGERVLLYGAGGRCRLFLRERDLVQRHHGLDERVIVGLIDDDPALRGRLIYRHRVLGSRLDIPQLVRQHRLNGIIIAAQLTPESQTAVHQLAREQGLHLTEWKFEEQTLTGPVPAPPKPRLA